MKTKTLICFFILCLFSINRLVAQNELPSREERIYTFSKIWKELEYNFAFPENFQQANLDSLYKEYLPRIEAVKDNYEYYRLLSSFTAHFNEAHTRILASQQFYDIPPLMSINIGKVIIIDNIALSMAQEAPVGSEVLKINDMPVLQYMNDSISPYISAATGQWKFDKSVLEIFSGKSQSTFRLTIKTPKGEIKDLNLTRNYYVNGKQDIMVKENQPPITIKMIEDNIGYLKLNSFMSTYIDTINMVFNSHLLQLQKAKGLIIDIRGNRGGSDVAWENIADYLMPDSVFDLGVQYFSRIHNACYKNWGINSEHPQLKQYNKGLAITEVEQYQFKNNIAKKDKLDAPIVILSGHHVASAAEDFLLLMKNNKRATVVGQPSVGCVGEPTIVPLTEGLSLMMCVKKYVCPDGSQPNDQGIAPDVYVADNYKSYLKGEDNILVQGIKELQMRIN